MESKPQTKGAQQIEQLLQQLSPNSERYQVLLSAKQFKASWVELGEWLARVSNSSHYSEWGFTSFEDYCTKEVRIRRQTAEKLLLAYRFLERKEPNLLERRQERPLPDYRSVDLLRKADEGDHFSAEEYSELRQAIVEEERSHPTVAKQFREISHNHQPEKIAVHRCKSALSAARRLATSLHELKEVPQELSQPVTQLITFLEGRLEEEQDDAQETVQENP